MKTRKLTALIMAFLMLLFSYSGIVFAEDVTEEYVDYSQIITEEDDAAAYVNYDVDTGETEYFNVESEVLPAAAVLDTSVVAAVDDDINSTTLNTEGYIPDDVSLDELEEELPVVSPDTIIGTDNRVRITSTSSYPYRAICYITISWKDGTSSRGTAWMYGNGVAITAGHCVYNQTKGWADSVTVWPGRNVSSSPYGSTYAKTLSTSTNWINNGSANYDWGVLVLNEKLGSSTGYFGLQYTTSSLNGLAMNVYGYPGEFTAQLWGMSGAVTSSNTNKIYYNIDTTGGQSGSPIYRYSSSYGYQSYGIHAYGSSSGNSGTRVTDFMFEYFTSFR